MTKAKKETKLQKIMIAKNCKKSWLYTDFTVADTCAEEAMASMTSYGIASISTHNSR